MKNGLISIKAFGILESVAKEANVKDFEWADAAKTQASRISEWRKMLKDYRDTGEIRKRKRPFTGKKCLVLLNGLRTLVGEELVNKKLLALVDKADEEELKILLLMSTLSPKKVSQLLMYVRALAEVPDPK